MVVLKKILSRLVLNRWLVKVLESEPQEHIKKALEALASEWKRGGGLELVEVDRVEYGDRLFVFAARGEDTGD